MSDEDDSGGQGTPAPVKCLVIEAFVPFRVRMMKDIAAKGGEAMEAVNPQDAIRHLANVGVPDSFVVSTSIGTQGALALVKGLGQLEKTRERPVLLLLHEASAAAHLSQAKLTENVQVVIGYQSIDRSVAALLGQASSGGSSGTLPKQGGSSGNLPKLSMDDWHITGEFKELDDVFLATEKVLRLVADNKLPGPMMPDLLQKVRELFANPDIALNDVAKFAARHQALAARLLALSNSAVYARVGGRVTSVDAAVSRLGLNETSSQLQAIAARSYLIGKSAAIRQMIIGNLEMAYVVSLVARETAKRMKLTRTDIYTIALFHNVGPTFMLYTLAQLQDKGQAPDFDKESLKLEVTKRAGQLNGIVCENLKLPLEVASIYAAERPGSEENVVKCIHQSMWVADRLLRTLNPESIVMDDGAALLGIDEGALELYRTLAPRWLELVTAYSGGG